MEVNTYISTIIIIIQKKYVDVTFLSYVYHPTITEVNLLIIYLGRVADKHAL